MAYFTHFEALNTPATYVTTNLTIPTWSKPFLVLIVTAIIIPTSSIVGHLLGIGAGFLLAMGRLNFMVEPPSKIVLWIENKLAPFIALIPNQIRYIREVDAIEIRKNGPTSSTAIPMHEAPSAASVAPVAQNAFKGHGNVLGTAPAASAPKGAK